MAQDPDEFDNFISDDKEDRPVVDTRADGRLLRVSLKRISPNLVNPREDFGTEEELADFGQSLRRRQIQALPVVTRKAYLRLWPGHEAEIGSVDVVIVSGERRYRAASTVGMKALECVINDEIAESRKTFLDAVVSENIDRQNFDPIEEAQAVEALVSAFGTASAVAEHFERVPGWVSQRRILLRLAPEVQQLVRRRALPLEQARKLGKLTKDNGWEADKQLAWWEQAQAERNAKKKAPRQRSKPTPQPSEEKPPAFDSKSEQFTAVKTERQPAAETQRHHAEDGRPSASSSAEPTPASASPPTSETPTSDRDTLPAASDPTHEVEPQADRKWEDWEALAEEITKRMKPDHISKLTVRLLAFNTDQAEAASATAGASE